jgi:hypothetical protein
MRLDVFRVLVVVWQIHHRYSVVLGWYVEIGFDAFHNGMTKDLKFLGVAFLASFATSSLLRESILQREDITDCFGGSKQRRFR